MANYSGLSELATSGIPAMFDVLSALLEGFVTLLLESIVVVVIVGAVLGAITGLIYIVVTYIKKVTGDSTKSMNMKK